MTAVAAQPGSRQIAVIGAGLGGLSAAVRLCAAGFAVTVIEARAEPGGRAMAIARDGFTFCAGPTVLGDRAGLEDLWSLTGTAVDRDVSLFAVNPHCRYSWPDGTTFDLAADDATAEQDVARFAPGDLAGYQDYARIAAAQLAEFRQQAGPAPFADLRDLGRHASGLARAQAWRSLWSLISAHVREERLREVLAVPALMDGADPFRASALLAAGFARSRQGGLWWPMGGPSTLCAALARRLEGMGGTLRLHDPVCRIHLLGNRAHEIETQSGWRQRFDAVISTADRVHTWRDLMEGSPRADAMTARLRKRPQGFGLFTVHFALEGTWPGIPHQMALMGPRFRGLIEDITVHGVLPQDQLVWLSHPSLADPTLAPVGKSVFQAQVPVANLGKLPIDWETVGPLLEQRVLAEIGRRLVPDIGDRLVTSFHVTPRDAMLDLNAALGSAAGLAPQPLWHAGALNPLRDKAIPNLYFAGAAAAPGGGLSAALASARACSDLIVETIT